MWRTNNRGGYIYILSLGRYGIFKVGERQLTQRAKLRWFNVKNDLYDDESTLVKKIENAN